MKTLQRLTFVATSAALAASAILMMSFPLDFFAQSQPEPSSLHLHARFSGVPEPVLGIASSPCASDDIPDANPRAFRDDRGIVHLFVSHFVARAMTGSDLDHVKRDCMIAYESRPSADPANYSDRGWLMAFHTDDGRHVAALVHSEFHAQDFRGECPLQDLHGEALNRCWLNGITLALSSDGGQHFKPVAGALGLVAAEPYRLDPHTEPGPIGYNTPAGIIKRDGIYYAFINDWPLRSQLYGTCVIRTQYVDNPFSWRAWNGNSFNTEFVNPYLQKHFDASKHVCHPVLPGETSGVTYLSDRHVYIAIQSTGDQRYGQPGIYFFSSLDLIHWSKPEILASKHDMRAAEPSGAWDFGYVSLLDPRSSDRDFIEMTRSPYLYYVRFDLSHNLARSIRRRRVLFTD